MHPGCRGGSSLLNRCAFWHVARHTTLHTPTCGGCRGGASATHAFAPNLGRKMEPPAVCMCMLYIIHVSGMLFVGMGLMLA